MEKNVDIKKERANKKVKINIILFFLKLNRCFKNKNLYKVAIIAMFKNNLKTRLLFNSKILKFSSKAAK